MNEPRRPPDWQTDDLEERLFWELDRTPEAGQREAKAATLASMESMRRGGFSADDVRRGWAARYADDLLRRWAAEAPIRAAQAARLERAERETEAGRIAWARHQQDLAQAEVARKAAERAASAALLEAYPRLRLRRECLPMTMAQMMLFVACTRAELAAAELEAPAEEARPTMERCAEALDYLESLGRGTDFDLAFRLLADAYEAGDPDGAERRAARLVETVRDLRGRVRTRPPDEVVLGRRERERVAWEMIHLQKMSRADVASRLGVTKTWANVLVARHQQHLAWGQLQADLPIVAEALVGGAEGAAGVAEATGLPEPRVRKAMRHREAVQEHEERLARQEAEGRRVWRARKRAEDAGDARWREIMAGIEVPAGGRGR